MNAKSIARLIRIEHSLMLCLGVITVILLQNLAFTDMQIAALLLTPFLISAGAFALNDYFDIESDKINKKDNPIVKGEIRETDALLIGAEMIAVGVIISWHLGMGAFIIAVLFAILSIAYDYKLKDIAVIGNAVIASSMAIVFIFTEISLAGEISELVLLISAVSFMSGIGREIQKTAQDMEGDLKGRKSKTLPMIIGKENALHLAAALIVCASLLALHLYFAVPPLQNNIAYLAIALCSIALFAYSTIKFYGDEKEMEIGRKYSLYALMLGIIAFLVGGL